MDHDPSTRALSAANLALAGRRLERTANRFASVELRELMRRPGLDPRHLAWEIAALMSVAVAAVLCVAGVWFL
jgi:hypothetical protein